MPRLKCIVEYDGTHFVGWQRQLNGRSVQEAIEQAIEKIAEKKITVFFRFVFVFELNFFSKLFWISVRKGVSNISLR